MLDFAVFGNPVAHSLSPKIHALFAKQVGLKVSYQKILAPKDDFINNAKAFISKGGMGFNITVPFKIDAFLLANTLTENAKMAGAVNTIKIHNNEIIGENTDGIGLVNDLINNLKLKIQNKRILILGAGGAVRGILLPLLKQNPKILMIANRTNSKAEKLAIDFSKHGKTCGFGLEKIKNTPVDIIINATSASLTGIMPEIKSGCAQGAVCYDLMYGKTTPFMHWAKDNGAIQIADGLGMLVEQAACSFEFWTKKRPETKSIIQALRRQSL
jgi:shikimate dehydrogenase